MKSKFIRKISAVLLLIALSIMLTAAQVSAAVTFDAKITDIRDGIVTVSGNAGKAGGEDLNILVINPGYTLADTATKEAALQRLWAVVPAADGSFSVSFPLNIEAEFEKGDFLVYVGGNTYGAPVEGGFTYASFEKRLEAAKTTYAKATADGILDSETLLGELAAYMGTAKDILGLNKAFSAVDANKIALSLAKAYSSAALDFGEALPDGEEKAAKELSAIEKLVADIDRLSALQAFRESKAEVLFDANGKILVDDILGLTDKVNANTTLISELANITKEGVNAINSSLLGVDIADETELAKNYAKSIILYGIKNNSQMGSAFITLLLSDANAEYAQLSIPNYLDLSSKDTANAGIIGEKSALTLENLATKIEEHSGSEGEEPQPGSTVTSKKSSDSSSNSGVKVISPAAQTEASTDVFSDIASYTWAKEAIEALAQKSIIAGMGDGTFNPGGHLTREQAVKIVCLALGIDITEEVSAPFADETDGAWYQPYLAIGRASGIAGGIGDNLFGVGHSISRQDFAVMLYRALNVKNDWEYELTFADSAEIADYAKEAVAYFAGRNIINGYTDNTFKPTASIGRAEASKLVYGLIK